MRYRLYIAVILPFAIATAAADGGKIYKWTDAAGKTHYSQQPPLKEDATVINMSATPPPAASTDQTAPSESINQDLQRQIRERAERQRQEREQRERAAAEADKEEGLRRLRAERDAQLIEQCKREGRSYCDSVESIQQAERRRARERERRREELRGER